MNRQKVLQIVQKNLDSAVSLLMDIIRIPSTRGQEIEISKYLKPHFEPLVDSVERIILPESIIRDPDYSFPVAGYKYNGEANLRLFIKGSYDNKSIAFNTHVDVVPPSTGQANAFQPVFENGKIFGRGAADCKGQIVTLWLLVKTLHDLGIRPAGDVIIDLVVEEECGGNGSLLVVRNGLEVDAAIILEPTELQVMHMIRGAVWFTVETSGKAGHSGSPGTTRSALKEAIEVMNQIEKVRKKMLTVSREQCPDLQNHPDPMPLTFGTLQAGNWPAATPDQAILKGVFGFLPPFNRKDIQRELTKAIGQDHADIRFDMLNNDYSFLEVEHPLVQDMLEAALKTKVASKPAFMNASCDAWRYSQQLNIPTIVFGGGSLSTAHSREEFIHSEEIGKAASVLINFIHKWSGLNDSI